MTAIRFSSPEYGEDGNFSVSEYLFEGDEKSGWKIFRNGALHLTLGEGFVPVRSVACGVCSTDLARKYLPYPLPQITGHEVVGYYNDKPVTVEINASHFARGKKTHCSFCNQGMDTQCPDRVTLGIDRLPGGFAPWFLAPVNAILEIPEGVSLSAAILTEPFAAALHAVEASGVNGGEVAVLGPRRLGMLALAALRSHRKANFLDYKIHALVRHEELCGLSLEMGADRCLDIREGSEELNGRYDVIFDTTGKPDGLKTALAYAKRAVHLKSTNGQAVLGMDHLTDLVVDEISLLPFRDSSFDFTWALENKIRENKNIFVDKMISEDILLDLKNKYPGRNFFHMELDDAKDKILSNPVYPDNAYEEKGIPEDFFPGGSPFPRFDLAIVSSLKTADRVIRPEPGKEYSLVRPRGAILLCIEDNFSSELDRAVCEKGIELHSSRCGSFRRALDLMKNDFALVSSLEKMITQRFTLDRIDEAFAVAADSGKSIKVVVNTGHHDA